MKNIIYIIEDNLKDMSGILDKLNKMAEKRNSPECKFEFTALCGTIEYEIKNEKYLSYEDGIIDEVKEILQKMEDDSEQRMCILLDIQLTKKNESDNEYQKADLAKKIYFTFRRQIPMYIITSTPWFATQGDVIMGVDLSEQFIAKNAILTYELEEDIDALFEFYQDHKIKNA